jgi:hypothetical protein
LKGYFKGDSEFTYENFHRLPYEYILNAYGEAAKLSMRELHHYEKPITLLATQTANLNRDPKTRKTPFTMQDFFLYQPPELLQAPEERYGAAAMWLVKENMYPAFALFCFPELNRHKGTVLPTIIAYLHENAIILAPVHGNDGTVKGLFIGEHAASNANLTMTSPCGREITIDVGTISDEVMAKEDAVFKLC